MGCASGMGVEGGVSQRFTIINSLHEASGPFRIRSESGRVSGLCM